MIKVIWDGVRGWNAPSWPWEKVQIYEGRGYILLDFVGSSRKRSMGGWRVRDIAEGAYQKTW